MGEKGVFLCQKRASTRGMSPYLLRRAPSWAKKVFFVSEGRFRSWEGRHICLEGPDMDVKGAISY